MNPDCDCDHCCNQCGHETRCNPYQPTDPPEDNYDHDAYTLG